MESEIGVGDGLRIEESNLTRDTWIRYLGYANEIGESFKRFISRRSYLASYLASSGYVVADAYYQCQKELERDSGEGSRIRVALQAGDSLIWQALASVIVPGICINRIVALTSSACKLGPVGKSASAVLPTVVGLASIPVIIGPIDRGVDFAMDRTVRGITTELLAKADVKPDPSN
mmetsp:Transcript_34075/g.133376  ORF Transcript_34075/g.133376 Transcript_34075/m.133376 type:complete len:176 (-) Transcript_34075:1604-2131(-)